MAVQACSVPRFQAHLQVPCQARLPCSHPAKATIAVLPAVLQVALALQLAFSVLQHVCLAPLLP